MNATPTGSTEEVPMEDVTSRDDTRIAFDRLGNGLPIVRLAP
jgi:hypothetical protein